MEKPRAARIAMSQPEIWYVLCALRGWRSIRCSLKTRVAFNAKPMYFQPRRRVI